MFYSVFTLAFLVFLCRSITKKLEKSLIKFENEYREDLDKTYKIISKVREEFEQKLNTEIDKLEQQLAAMNWERKKYVQFSDNEPEAMNRSTE